LGVVVVENFRQPSPQSRSDRARAFLPLELADRSAARLVRDRRVTRHCRPAGFALARCRIHAQAAAVAVANAFAWNIGVSETDPKPDRTYLGVPAERCCSQPDSSRSDTLAGDYHAAPLAGMGHLRRSGAERANRPCGLICGNVVC